MHYLTPKTFAEGDGRTADLWYLPPVLLTHLRTALDALDEGGVSKASVYLMYAVDAATMTYGVWHDYTNAIRSLRFALDRGMSPEGLERSVGQCLASLTDEALAAVRLPV